MHALSLSWSWRTPRPDVLALWLAGGGPFVAYAFTSSGFAYWLDSGEFVAASVSLASAHPPGHPASAIWGQLWCLLPLGSLSFRVAVGQAAASAIASALHCRATAHALSRLAIPPLVTWTLALFAAWLSAFTYALWFQAVRPEVYALQTLCVAAICERLLAGAGGAGTRSTRPLATAACLLGLALTNHHLTALLLVPAFLPAVWDCLARKHLRSLLSAFAGGALGLCVYVFLPLRAAHVTALSFGDPRTWDNFWWVVSARVYAHDMGSEAGQPLGTRVLDVIALWLDDVTLLPLLMAVVGLYMCLRLRSTRRSALVLALVWIVDAVARAWLGPVRANPDILGYLAPSYLAIASLAAMSLGVLCSLLEGIVMRRAVWGVVCLAPISTLALIPGALERSSLADFSATDDFDDLRIRALPARAVVFLSSPQAVFRALEDDVVEASRPDLLAVQLPFLRYPGAAEALLSRHPDVRDAVSAYLAQHDQLQSSSLAKLAASRPVFVELDTHVSPQLLLQLRPRALLTQLAATPVARDAAQLDVAQQALARRLGTHIHETETARQLLWIHYMNGIHLGVLGARSAASIEVARARALHPEERRLPQLTAALRGDGPFDPLPFLKF